MPQLPAKRCGRGRALAARPAAPAEAGGEQGPGPEPGPMAATDPPGAVELPQLAENLLCRLQENFQALTEKLTLRMQEMGERITDLEKRVADLMTEAGVENSNEELGIKTLT